MLPQLPLLFSNKTNSIALQSQSGSVPMSTPQSSHLPTPATPPPPAPNPTNISPRVQVAPECITKFNELKLGKTIKYIIYALSDDYKSIIVEDTSEDADWDAFREKLINAKSKTKSGALTKGPRYAVYDFNYDLASGEGQRSKITFIAWSPDDAGIQVCEATQDKDLREKRAPWHTGHERVVQVYIPWTRSRDHIPSYSSSEHESSRQSREHITR